MMKSKIIDSQIKYKNGQLDAGTTNHHAVMGPGDIWIKQWLANGLELPDLEMMRQYRLQRIFAMLKKYNYDGVLLLDPMNIRYATDATNMQVWVMHNQTRYVWVGADEHVVLWEYLDCEFLSQHNPLISEVRPLKSSLYFLAGDSYQQRGEQWAQEIIDVVRSRCGDKARIAVDICPQIGYQQFEHAGIVVGNGQQVMEQSRKIKSVDEIKAMRCAIHACESTMEEMYQQLQPGMTERDIWSMLHAGNIRRGGEWIETQLLASGPRTNPWMQEASCRVMQDGDMLAYDTDMVGVYGMMVDISRSWIVGNKQPDIHQQHIYELALEQINRNFELMKAGNSFKELSYNAWMPPREDYRHYSLLFHGVGQCDEYPGIPFAHQWDHSGFSGELEVGMVLTVEAYVGARKGGEGVKLEQQVLITETGPELMTHFPIELIR